MSTLTSSSTNAAAVPAHSPGHGPRRRLRHRASHPPAQARIICATDFSPDAQGAADVAAALGRMMAAKVVLVHVAEEADVHPLENLRASPETATCRLRAEAQRVRKRGAAVIDRLLQGRSAEHEIERLLHHAPPLLLVTSSVAKSALERWVLGSVSEAVAQTSPVPTLVVRKAAPLLAWADGRATPLRIVVGVGMDPESQRLLRWVAPLRRFGPCEIVIGHINWPPHDRATFGDGPLALAKNTPRIQRWLERDLAAKAREGLGDEDFQVRVRPSWGRPDVPLIDLAREERAELLVVGTHQWHGFSRIKHGSVSREILRHAPMNVACVPIGRDTRSAGGVATFRRIVVATDFSPAGNAAIACGFGAAAPGAAIKLVHVVPHWLPANPLPAHRERRRITPREIGRWEAEICRRLRERVPGEAAARSASIECEVLQHDDVARAILQEAARFGADLICLGSRRRHGLGVLRGSVSRAVIAQSERPVLIACHAG